MKPIEIIAAMKAKEPKVLGDVPEKKAEQILKAALTHIRELVVAAEPGDLPIGMLGRFKVMNVTKGEGAEAVTHRRVIFVPPKPGGPDGPGQPADQAQAAPEGAPAAGAKAKAGKPARAKGGAKTAAAPKEK